MSLGQACPQSCTSGEGRAEEEGMQEPPKTCYLPEKALGKGLGGHQSEVGAFEPGRAPIAPLHGGAEEV